MEFVLPMPPSANRLWRHVGNRVLLSKQARTYRETVGGIVRSETFITLTGPLEVDILVYPPDRKRRDVDNLLKPLLDSLQHAKVFEDDSQIQRLVIERQEPTPKGYVNVIIDEAIPLRPTMAERRCLKCHCKFASTGPGNRICPKCTQLNNAAGPIPEAILAGQRGRKRLNGETIDDPGFDGF